MSIFQVAKCHSATLPLTNWKGCLYTQHRNRDSLLNRRGQKEEANEASRTQNLLVYLYGTEYISSILSKQNSICRNGCLLTKKFSPSREDLNYGISMAFESGLISKWRYLGLPLEAFIEARLPLVHNNAKMTLEQLSVALALYGAVLASSVLAFIKEVSLTRQRNTIMQDDWNKSLLAWTVLLLVCNESTQTNLNNFISFIIRSTLNWSIKLLNFNLVMFTLVDYNSIVDFSCDKVFIYLNKIFTTSLVV